MVDVIVDWIGTGVNAVLSAVFIAGVIVVLASVQSLNRGVSDQQVLAEEMKEYTEFNQYDFTHVYSQDIITAIYQYRGEPEIFVMSSKGNYTWAAGSAPCEYTTAEITELIDPDVIYDATIEYGNNGEIVSLDFVTHVVGCGR